MKYCGQCGHALTPGSKFCGGCGLRLVPAEDAGGPPSRPATDPAAPVSGPTTPPPVGSPDPTDTRVGQPVVAVRDGKLVPDDAAHPGTPATESESERTTVRPAVNAVAPAPGSASGSAPQADPDATTVRPAVRTEESTWPRSAPVIDFPPAEERERREAARRPLDPDEGTPMPSLAKAAVAPVTYHDTELPTPPTRVGDPRPDERAWRITFGASAIALLVIFLCGAALLLI